MHSAIHRWEDEYKKLEGEHNLISRYHERLYFQRLMHKTKEELLERYKWVAYIMESLQASIDEYRAMVCRHLVAVEELHTSMDPFKGVDLKEIPLVQLPMFNT